MTNHSGILSDLFLKATKELPRSVVKLPQSGSSRIYYRLQSGSTSLIGVFNDDVEENRAFFYLAAFLKANQLPVPEIIVASECQRYYLQTDLGTTSLLDRILLSKSDDYRIEPLLYDVVKILAKFNALGYNNLELNRLYPVKYFDERSAKWDLNYFKYCFLKPSGVLIDEIRLEEVFDYICTKVLEGDNQFLQYRDFQSRNIMLTVNGPYLIDFQAARVGPGLYDLASFLFQAKANFSDDTRKKLLNYYLDELSIYRNINRYTMTQTFQYMVVFRILQTLGAYGFRGLVERKSHFLESIPLALENLNHILVSINDKKLRYLNELILKLKQSFPLQDDNFYEGLVVNIFSFSLKKGYPPLHNEYGGGFVFDCRFLPNPGRHDEFKMLSGLDQPVIAYLDAVDEVSDFIQHSFNMVERAVNQYIKRNFKHLSVGFGCTGGQHRSVYCAERFTKMLQNHFTGDRIKLIVRHIELER